MEIYNRKYLLWIFIINFIYSQEINRCSTEEYYEQLILNNPILLDSQSEFENRILSYYQRNNSNRNNDILTIPVVVHVLYNTNDENISDEQIFSQIEALNEDFRRQNEDAINTREEFIYVASDTKIEFRLAAVDPDGQLTGGITRTYTDIQEFEVDSEFYKFTEFGGIDNWEPGIYLNIWVCDLSDSELGYATYPWLLDDYLENDGVVINYQAFGKGNNFNLFENYNLGRTCTHEIGHWLGLYHTFHNESCLNNNCYENGDRVCDTPPDNTTSFGCNYTNVCNLDSPDLPDQIENYMDYSDDVCMNMFSEGQSFRMNGTMAIERYSLINPEYFYIDGIVSGSGYNETSYKHLYWTNNDNSYNPISYLLERTFVIGSQIEEIAVFKQIHEYHFENNISTNLLVELSDPWRVIEGYVQSDAYFYPDISHEVFQDQNPNFIPNIPTYRLRATEIVENGAFTYEFTNWSGDAEFNGHEADLETDVVFTEPYGTITANYEAVEEAISVILRDANGNALSGLIQVEIAELPLNTEPESLTYDNSMNPLELAMVLDSDSRTIWGQIVHTTPIVRLVDEFYPLQWHLNNTGQSGGISGYDINTELAWDITTGSEEIIVAVIDDGVEEHEDFEDWIKLILWERERLFK